MLASDYELAIRNDS